MIDIEIIKTEVPAIINDDVLEIRDIGQHGEVNQVFYVKSKKNENVLRVNEVGEEARFAKEKWCSDISRKAGVLTPEMIRSGATDTFAFTLDTYVEGVNGKDYKGNLLPAWRRLGKYARKINSISVEGFGERMTSPGVFYSTWEEFLQYNIESLSASDEISRRGIITKDQSKLILKIFKELRNEEASIGLIHNDISLHNSLITLNGDVVLIDWGSAEASVVPQAEFVSDILRSYYTPEHPHFLAFLEGYNMSQDELKILLPSIRRFQLLQSMDKLRWAIDKCENRIEKFSKQVQTDILLNS